MARSGAPRHRSRPPRRPLQTVEACILSSLPPPESAAGRAAAGAACPEPRYRRGRARRRRSPDTSPAAATAHRWRTASGNPATYPAARRQPRQPSGLAHVHLAIRCRTLPVEQPQVPVRPPRARPNRELLLRHKIPVECASIPSANRAAQNHLDRSGIDAGDSPGPGPRGSFRAPQGSMPPAIRGTSSRLYRPPFTPETVPRRDRKVRPLYVEPADARDHRLLLQLAGVEIVQPLIAVDEQVIGVYADSKLQAADRYVRVHVELDPVRCAITNRVPMDVPDCEVGLHVTLRHATPTVWLKGLPPRHAPRTRQVGAPQANPNW